jgi:peptidoglycan/xylan/chitin deacetylase (PgdA/CDA1 family)
MVKINLTFDVEEQEGGNPFSKGCDGVLNILRLLKRRNIKAIFFITAVYAENFPELIKRISADGHEIGCHGYDHKSEYDELSDVIALRKLSSARKLLMELSCQKVLSFRAPRMLPPKLNIIKKAGFRYDYSLHPAWVPGRYFNLLKSRKCQIKNGVKIIPATVTPIFRLPLSWIWFKFYPLPILKILTRLALINQDKITLYFHNWEFDDANKLKKLEKYIKFLKELN